MKILSENQQYALAEDLQALFDKHGLSGGYVVAELRTGPGIADHVTVITTGKIGALTEMLAIETYKVIQYNSVTVAPKINDN